MLLASVNSLIRLDTAEASAFDHGESAWPGHGEKHGMYTTENKG